MNQKYISLSVAFSAGILLGALVLLLLNAGTLFAANNTQSQAILENAPINASNHVTLTLLHNNDGESALLAGTNNVPTNTGYPNTAVVDLAVGGVASFKQVMDNQIAAVASNGNAVVSVYAGDAFLASSILACSLPPANGPVYDAVAQRQMPYTAHVLGNHEFDFQPDFLERFIRAFDDGDGLEEPFLSANLDFANEPGFNNLVDADGLIEGEPADDRPLARSMVHTDTTTGAVFGIVGATTPQLPIISSPGNVSVTANITETAAAVQTEINRLDNMGINKIVFVSHLQDIDNDRQIIGMLRGVDLAVGGGGDELLVNHTISQTVPVTDQLLPGEDPSDIFGEYPMPVMDADAETVYLVTMKGQYKYLGRLDVVFDVNGEVTQVVQEESYPRRVIPNTASNNAAIMALGVNDEVTPDNDLITSVTEPVQACLDSFDNTNIAFTEVDLDVSRNGVRGGESNAGNLITDAFVYAFNNSGLISINPVVAVQNGGGIRQNAGDTLQNAITRRNTLDILPFGNEVSAIWSVSPTVLKAVFEHSVSDGLPDGGFLQVSGISVIYNLHAPVGSRVVSLQLATGEAIVTNGNVVTDGRDVVLVTNSFIARGGDGYAMLSDLDKASVGENGVTITYERALSKYLTEDTMSFPETAANMKLSTIRSTDSRYAVGGQGRIRILNMQTFLPIIGQN